MHVSRRHTEEGPDVPEGQDPSPWGPAGWGPVHGSPWAQLRPTLHSCAVNQCPIGNSQ